MGMPKMVSGHRIKCAREDAGLSRDEVVRRSAESGNPISTHCLIRIETGETKAPRMDTMITLADILDTSLENFIASTFCA